METLKELKELKAIRDDAPDGATEFIARIGRCKYYKFSNHGCWYYFEGNNWIPIEKPQISTRSLSDIKRIIELMEINEAMHKQVAGYLTGADWQHWQDFNKSKFEVMK